MKKQFLSKSVPRGTRTIWRYLGALFLLFTFAIGQMWGTEVTVGFTTATGASGSNTTRSIVEEDHITVTHIFNSGTSGALALYTNSDKQLYCGSSTAVYTKGGYKWNKNTGTTFNDNYVGFQVDVEDGYKFSLSELELTLAVTSNFVCKVEIFDGTDVLYESDSWTIANNGKNNTNGINPTFTAVGNPDLQDLTGTFYVRVQLAFNSTGKYLCCPVFTVTGELEETGGGGSDPVAVTGISLAPSSATIKVGKTVTLVPTITPNDATDKAVTWAVTSGSSYASVTDAGVVTGLAAGTAVVTATAHDGSGITQTATITVEACPTSGTVFSMNITADEGTAYTGNNTFPALIGATYVGGAAYSGSKSGTNRTSTIDANGEYPFSANSELAIKVVMDCDLAEGDIIDITTSSTRQIKIQKVVGTELYKTANKTFTIPSGSSLIGENVFYLMRDNSESTLGSLTVTRPVYRTITLEYADGATADGSIEVIDGTAATKPADPTWEHHRFAGWYNGSDPYDWSETVGGDLTLTAHWTQLYTITFANGGGTGDAPAAVADKAQGETFEVPANTFTAPTNKEFDIWNDGSVDYAPGVTYTVGTANVVLTAQWKALQDKYTVIFKDGDVTLGTKQFDVASNPSDADIEKTKPLYTFAAWQKDAADIALDAAFWASVLKDAEVTLTARYEGKYASSINVEQWVLDNGAGKGATTKTSALLAEMGTKNYLSNIAWVNKTNELDTLDDSKTDGKRNYAYLGLKVKNDASNVRLLLQDGKSLKVKFGNVAATPNIKIGDAAATPMTITEGVYSLDAASGDREITISTTSAGAVVFKQIMIDEPIADVVLPAIVTFDANGGTYTDASVKYTGTPLVIGDATPADEDHEFAGWFDGDDQIDASGYVPTKNVTLQAHYSNKKYTVTYLGGEGATGLMDAVETAWDEDYTALPCSFEKVNHSFSTWAVVGVAGITEIAAGSSFVMPKGNVTLTAQWVNEALVARIGDNYYESLPEAVAAATNGQTVYLLKDVTAGPGVMIESANAKNITIDFGGFTYIVSTPAVGSTNTKTQGFHFEQGCTITMQNGTIGSTGDEVKMLVQNYCDLTLINIKLDGTDLAGTGRYTLSNNCGNVVIGNGAEIVAQAGGVAFDVCYYASYPSVSVTVLPGASIDGKIEMSMSNNKQGVEENCQLIITGGEFENFSIDHTNIPEAGVNAAISAGTFDAPVENLYCADGFVPTPEDPVTHKYTVEPKEGVEIIGAVVTGNTTADVTGAYKGTASVKLNNKKLDNGDYYFYVTLADGYTFEEGDVMVLDLNAKSDIGTGTKALEITTGVGNIDGAVWKSIAFEEYTAGENTIPLTGIAEGQTSIGLKRSANQNAKINGLKVYRPMKPVLSAITIDGRVGVINEANKTVAVQIPYEADLAALTVAPTIIWNAPATENSIVVNNGSAWVEDDNTYKLTDKDGDYTVYTITLTRDVLKHTVSFNTHGGSAVASELVEDGGYLAAAPADPTKEDYIFQYWSEDEDGAEVDVTTVQINADKEFHAVWEAEPAGIKLFNGNVLNTTNFISAAATTIEISEVEYPCLVAFASNRTSLAGAKQGDLVMYSATTDAAKIKFDLYNANSSAKKAYVWGVEEGDDEATQLDAIEVAGTTRVKTAYYEFNGTKNRTVYLTSGSKADIKVLQAKVIESGSAIKQFGDAGYTLKLNQGRIAAATTAPVQFEGATVNVSSDYAVLNNSNLSTKSYIKFTTTVDKMILHVEKSGGKFYVSQDPEDKGTIYNANTDVELTPAGEWYLGSETSGSAASFTNIAFIAPKCAEPAFNALANSDICEGASYEALDGTATVADAGVPTYQWYREDDSAIDGETNATYTPTADGKYYVIAVNHLVGYTDNEKKSALVTVTTHAGTAISEELANQRGNVDDVVTLEVVASGKNLHYTWKESATIDGSYTDVAGAADAASLNVTITEGMSKYYKVVVSGDCGDAQESIAKVEQFIPVAQADVTGSIAWNWANAASVAEIKLTNQTSPKKNEGFVMANGAATVYNNANFESDKLYLEGEYIVRDGKYFQGQTIKFNTTVAGVVRVKFSHTGNNKPARELYINGVGTGDSRTNATAAWSRYVDVPAGEVTITAYHVDPADGAGQQYIRVPEIEFLTIAHRRTTGYNVGDLGTVCLEDATIIDGATLYELQGLDEHGYLAFDEIQSGELEAGKPYLFEVTNPSQISFYKPVGAAHSDTEIETNGMIGTFSGTTLYQGAENYYYFSGRHIWKVNDFTVAIPIPANRCYVDYDVLLAAPAPLAPAPGRRRVTMGVQGTQVATGCENLNVSDKPVKMLINGQLFILRGEKMYDAKGQLVK